MVCGLGVNSAPAATAPNASPLPLTSCPPYSGGVLNTAPTIASGAKTVALTFDDGPGRSTPAILAILDSFHVRATFFNVGYGMTDYTSSLLKERAEGYLLGNHTVSHPDMALLPASGQLEQMTQVDRQQRALTSTVDCVFRPPYGDYNNDTIAMANQLGMSLWMWSDGGGDWEARGSGSSYWINYIERNVIAVAQGQDHPVVLLHNQPIDMPATVAALPTIIRWFLAHGYTFVDLLGRSGPPNTCGDPSVPTPPSPFTTVGDGVVLRVGDKRLSPHGQFALSVSSEGKLNYHEVGGPVMWVAPVVAGPNASASFRNGTLALRSAAGTVVWSTRTNAPSGALHLNANGSLALVTGERVLFSTPTTLTTIRTGAPLQPGWYVSSPDGRCRLLQRTTGELALFGADQQVLWRDGRHAGGVATELRPDGNLVTVTSSGAVVWSSALPAHPGDELRVTDQGTVTITTTSHAVVWATP